MVYFSPAPWSSFEQRPHKFVKWYQAKHARHVLWIDPYPTRLPEAGDFYRLLGAGRVNVIRSAPTEFPRWITVLRPSSLPIEPLAGSGRINQLLWKNTLRIIQSFLENDECPLVVGKPSELALIVLSRHATSYSLFDAMDNYSAFYRGLSRDAMWRRECAVAARVSRISVSSTKLARRFDLHRAKLSIARNACDGAMLPPVSSTTRLPGTGVLGYVGTIGRWFDWRLVFRLAEENQSMSVRLVGPVYVLPRTPLPPNVELIPACAHRTALGHMGEFSVGLIPFRRTALTAFVDPIKYYEYRALGMPVLSTRFGEMALREKAEGVFLLDGHEDLAEVATRALGCASDSKTVREFRAANSWEARFDEIGMPA